MTLSKLPQARYRKDYHAPKFTIDTVHLTFYLDDTRTKVISQLSIISNEEGAHLELDGEQLELTRVLLNGKELSAPHDYQVQATGLVIFSPPRQFELQIENYINPSANTALEGLYKSEGVFCSQCEAEGFRYITYFLDRPDVLAVYTTTIYVADKKSYPYLLSNGNKIGEGVTAEGLSWVKWHDPFPKPSYLFALVAGDFDCLEDSYTTQEGRQVTLQLFVDKGNKAKAEFAMASLKHAMAWDEQRFNLSYDLDIYMIVAVDFFNMGAMENKGLNVFNAKYVLVDAASATDQDFINVEAVIGHEYFHNWTGNRVTCRDWFQLSLKEGLTVFREQEFSADRGMRSVQRIQDVRIMRTQQFDEDAGPTAHAIRPDEVLEMNNFYTVTIYNKGAEVVRMLHTLLGETAFQAGIQEYICQQDGKAATCEDFIHAFETTSGKDLNQFRRWYSQRGTPKVRISTEYKRRHGRLIVTLEQSCDQPCNAPFHIPLQVEFLSRTGAPEPLPAELPENSVLELVDAIQTFEFTGFKKEPVLAPLVNFSAPIKLITDFNEENLILILRQAQDPFLRWDAAQQIYTHALHTAIHTEQEVVLPTAFIQLLRTELVTLEDPALLALLLQIPAEEALSVDYARIPVAAIEKATQELFNCLQNGLQVEFIQLWQRLWPQVRQQIDVFNAVATANRMLINVCLNFMAASAHNDEVTQALEQQFACKENMTLVFGALQAVVHRQHPLAAKFLSSFEQDWQDNPLVLDKWFAVQASKPQQGATEGVQQLIAHSAFDWRNPNRVYAVLATYGHNFSQLHREDGAGYRLLVAAIEKLNAANPQVASRLLSPLLKWHRLDEQRQQLLRPLLEQLLALPNLAPDLFEKINQSFINKGTDLL